MNQNSFSRTARITVFATGLFIPSLNFCPSATPPPVHRSLSYEDLERNYGVDTERKYQLARAINETDFATFKELYCRVNPNFAIPRKRKGKESIVPIFRVLEVYDHSPLCQYSGHICKRQLMLRLLLEKGANFDVTNRKGQRPLDLANEKEKDIFRKHEEKRKELLIAKLMTFTHVLDQ